MQKEIYVKTIIGVGILKRYDSRLDKPYTVLDKSTGHLLSHEKADQISQQDYEQYQPTKKPARGKKS